MIRSALSAVMLFAVACAGAPTATPGDEIVEAFMRDYTAAWNAHDSARIAERFYRTGPAVPEQTASLERGFESLRAQGYKNSAIHEIKGCVTGPDTAWAGMKFSRLKADGEPLPPRDRASSYDLKKFDDGWRIVKLNGWDAATPLACPAG
ncbi:MAG: hypothetical protein SGJ21_01900 [Alphaproteobacteria bacterium]|nr:hypothetical protein [Alphaproteobacteria bacterium]